MGRPPSPHQVQPILHMTLRSRFFIQRFFPEKINGIPNLWDYSWMIMPSGKSIKFQPDILRKGNFLKSYYNFSRECNIIKRVFAIVKLKLILWILYCTDHYWIRWMKDQSSWLCPDKLRERRATQQSRDCNLAIILVSTVVMFFLCHLPRVVTRSSSWMLLSPSSSSSSSPSPSPSSSSLLLLSSSPSSYPPSSCSSYVICPGWLHGPSFVSKKWITSLIQILIKP